MLSIERKTGESVILTYPGGTVRVNVFRIAPGRDGGTPTVQLAFDAPRDVVILRDELKPRLPKVLD